MKRRNLIATLTLVLLVGAGTAYLVDLGTKSCVNSQCTSCTITAPTIGVVIRIVENNGSGHPTIPVAGVGVSGQSLLYCNEVRETFDLQPTTTNSSGWASLLDGNGGMYYLNINYSSTQTYNLSILTQPTAVTTVTYDISSGNVTTHVCYYAVC